MGDGSGDELFGTLFGEDAEVGAEGLFFADGGEGLIEEGGDVGEEDGFVGVGEEAVEFDGDAGAGFGGFGADAAAGGHEVAAGIFDKGVAEFGERLAQEAGFLLEITRFGDGEEAFAFALRGARGSAPNGQSLHEAVAQGGPAVDPILCAENIF